MCLCVAFSAFGRTSGATVIRCLSGAYQAPIRRLSGAYQRHRPIQAAPIKRSSGVYPAPIRRLSGAHPAPIADRRRRTESWADGQTDGQTDRRTGGQTHEQNRKRKHNTTKTPKRHKNLVYFLFIFGVFSDFSVFVRPSSRLSVCAG